MVKDFRSITSQKLNWQIITPNKKADWINQRDGLFDTLIPLYPSKKFDLQNKSFFSTYSLGTATARDAWVYNYGLSPLRDNMKKTMAFFNDESSRVKKIMILNCPLKVHSLAGMTLFRHFAMKEANNIIMIRM